MNGTLHRRKSCVGAFSSCAKVHPLLHEMKLGTVGVGGPELVCLRRHNYATLFHSFMGVDSRDMTHHFPLFLQMHLKWGQHSLSYPMSLCTTSPTGHSLKYLLVKHNAMERKNMLISICSVTLPDRLVIL